MVGKRCTHHVHRGNERQPKITICRTVACQIGAPRQPRSREITLEEWRRRPFGEKLWEHTVALFRSQM
jgi:hypothetical protein